MRVNLNVPYAEKDIAKKLGARWDGQGRRWYVENMENLKPFLRWMPDHLRKAHKKKRPGLKLKDIPKGWKAPEWCR